MPKPDLTISVNDEKGSVCVVTLKKVNGVAGEAEVNVSVREDINQTALLALFLSIFSTLPEVHPLLIAKLLSLRGLLEWYIPTENGGRMKQEQEPLEVIVFDRDDELPF